MNNDMLKIFIVLAISLSLVIPVYALSGTVTLLDPNNYTFTNADNDTIEFEFWFEGDNATADCDLYINGSSYNSSNVANNTNTSVYANDSINVGYNFWYVECINETAIFSETRMLIIDKTNISVPDWEPMNYSNDASPFIYAGLFDNYIIDNSSLTMEINGTNHTYGVDDDIDWTLMDINPDYGFLDYYNSSIVFSDNDLVNVTVYATDEAGNVMEPYNWSFKIDTEPPVLNFTLSINESIGPNNPTIGTINATDDEYLVPAYFFNIIDWNLDDRILKWFVNVTSNDTTPLTHYIENESWDATGFILSNGTTNTTELITVFDSYYYYVDGWFNETNHSTIIFNGTSPYNFVDIWGNGSEIVDGVDTFRIINYNISNPFDGVNDTTLFVINQSTFRLYNVIANDSHDYGINSVIRDYAGNEVNETINVSIDTTPPTVTLYIPENYTWFTNTSVDGNESIIQDFKFLPSDANGLQNCTVTLYNMSGDLTNTSIISNPVSDANNTATFTWNGSETDVRYNWNVMCYDNASNPGYSTNFTWGIDRNPPLVSKPSELGKGCGFINVVWGGNDVASGIKEFNLYMRVSTESTWVPINGPFGPSEMSYNNTGLSPAGYVFKVNATDNVNWIGESPESVEIIITQEMCGTGGNEGGNQGETFIADTRTTVTATGSFDIVNFEPTITINPGETKTSQFTIKNTNPNNILTITVSLAGIPAEWFTLGPTSIDNLLHDIGEEIVTITFNIPENATPGDTTLTMKATGTEAFTSKAMTAEATNTLTITGEVEEVVTTGENPLTGLFSLITENPAIFLIGGVGITAVLYTRFKDKIHNFFQTRIFRRGVAYKPKKLN